MIKKKLLPWYNETINEYYEVCKICQRIEKFYRKHEIRNKGSECRFQGD